MNKCVKLFTNYLLILLFIPIVNIGQIKIEKIENFPIKKIVGTIINQESGTPVEQAIIKVKNTSNSKMLISTNSDFNGKFIIEIKESNNFEITINLIGYEPKNITNLNFVENKNTIELGEIYLKPSLINLDDVKIEGNYKLKIDVDKKVYKIDSNAVLANGSASDILQNIPSIFINQNGAVLLRGGSVKIYVNGKPSGLLGISRSQILDYIPANLIDSIEVINDPSAKYDADGSSGIINIILKNQNKPGINGLITLSAGTLSRYNGSVNLSLNYKKLNLFTSFDNKIVNINSWETKNRTSILSDTIKHIEQDREYFSKTINQNFRFRGEYALDKKNVLGFSYLTTKTIDNDITNINYTHFNYLSQITRLYYRKINEKDYDNSTNFTLNYVKKFKKSQHQLSSDFFYSKGTENTVGDIYQKYYNLDYSPSSQLPAIANTYNYTNETNIVGQIDYDQPLNKKTKIELGYKIRSKKIDSSYQLDNYYQPLDIFITDTSITNNFNYNFIINAGYITYRKKTKSFSYKIGSRIEQTNINFNISKDNIKNNFSYFDFFPSVHLLKEFNNNNKLTFRYSRRIDRPSFNEINPLQQYNDPLFLNKGNINLLPEYINSFDITHIKSWTESSISGSIYFRHSTGTIQRIVVLEPNGVTTTNFQNLNNLNILGAELTTYFKLYNWWKINSSLNIYKSSLDGTNIGSEFNTNNYSVDSKINNNFTPWKRSMIQVSANYQSPTYSALTKNYGQSYIDASFKQDFCDKKLSISLRCTDIFLSQRRDYDMNGSNFIVNSRFNRQSRVIYLGVTFRPFRNHKKAIENEENEEKQSENNDEEN